jgi:flagellar basal-body rod protein FlgB
MSIYDVPLFSMLRTRMQWHQERQHVLADNVANADMPKFRPRDLVPPDINRPLLASNAPLGMTQTDGGHLVGLSGNNSSQFRTTSGGYEVRPSGNAVDLEDEMIKVAANQMDYQAATTLYTRSLNLLKTALGKR